MLEDDHACFTLLGLTGQCRIRRIVLETEGCKRLGGGYQAGSAVWAVGEPDRLIRGPVQGQEIGVGLVGWFECAAGDAGLHEEGGDFLVGLWCSGRCALPIIAPVLLIRERTKRIGTWNERMDDVSTRQPVCTVP